MINAVDCRALALSVTGEDQVWEECDPIFHICIGFTADQAQSWCETAAMGVGDLVSDLLAPLSFDSWLLLDGDCDLYEDDLDLLVDRLENGHYSGQFRVDGQLQEGTFAATFTGVRRR
ncbi:MAG: hypothetical protein FJ125_10695 [Deltaproteobacteria bacterium]|nr:hypothetical protein [Deltaproteobacteria bacterium]